MNEPANPTTWAELLAELYAENWRPTGFMVRAQNFEPLQGTNVADISGRKYFSTVKDVEILQNGLKIRASSV